VLLREKEQRRKRWRDGDGGSCSCEKMMMKQASKRSKQCCVERQTRNCRVWYQTQRMLFRDCQLTSNFVFVEGKKWGKRRRRRIGLFP
jgi:hypothetical protein